MTTIIRSSSLHVSLTQHSYESLSRQIFYLLFIRQKSDGKLTVNVQNPLTRDSISWENTSKDNERIPATTMRYNIIKEAFASQMIESDLHLSSIS